MRTARLLPVSPSMVCSWEGSAPWGGLLQGGLLLGGCLLLGEMGVSQHALRQAAPCEQNDRHV